MLMHAWSLKDWLEQPALGPAILVLDGGVSTHLENILRQKDQVFSNRSLWSSSLLLTEEGRRDIVATHEAFYQHGADIGTTVTYQCHFGTVSSCCPVEPQGVMVQMIQNGVQLAQTAAASSADNNSNKYVVASIGCYGAALADGSEYKGNYNISKDQLKDFYRRKVRLLAHGCQHPPDAIAFETIPCGMEVDAIMELLQEQRITVPCWISLACCNESQLNDGTEVTDVLKMIQQLDPDSKLLAAIGINCCDSQYIHGLVSKLISNTIDPCMFPPRAIVIYPNSGEEWDAASSTWKEGTGCTQPQEFANVMLQTIELVYRQRPGVHVPKLIVGGCCRTSPETIAALRTTVDTFLERTKKSSCTP